MSTLIIVAGLPGVGKTTICRILKKKLNCTFLDDDEYAKASPHFKQADITKITPLQLNKIREKFWGHKLDDLKKLLLNKDLVIVDAVFDLIPVRKKIYKMLESIGSDYVILKVVCPDSIVKKRIIEDRSKTRPGASPETRLRAYKRMKASWKPIRKKHVTINSSGLVLPKLADVIKQLR